VGFFFFLKSSVSLSLSDLFDGWGTYGGHRQLSKSGTFLFFGDYKKR